MYRLSGAAPHVDSHVLQIVYDDPTRIDSYYLLALNIRCEAGLVIFSTVIVINCDTYNTTRMANVVI